MLDVTVDSSRGEADDAVSQSLPAEVLIAPDDGWSADLDETVILLSPDCTIAPNDLADLLEDSCFCARDDVDDDSWSTQQRNFLMQARQIASALLLGEDAAILERIRDIVHEEIGWLIPAVRRVSMVACAGEVELAIVNEVAVSTSD